MKALLPLLLVSAAAHAEKAWVFEPGQALVSVEVGPARARLSAISLGMSGKVRELGGGALQAEVRLSLASFTTGAAARDQEIRQQGNAADFPEIVFQGTSGAPDDDGKVNLKGTLTFHGASRPLSVPVTVVHMRGTLFGHAVLALHLSDFGLQAPLGASDEVRIEVDAGLRPEDTVASRG
jgi:polyisoprenoid-binding protein YceI